ncbi:MAG: hypothetical protein L0338_22960 [Acidobacteria bacterium]|nr:hypothetical protein [Acidobacteriota bacterium]
MAGGVAEPLVEGKDSQPVRPGRGGRKPRNGQVDGGEGLRFFLAKHGAVDGVPNFEREFATEPEAMVESLKTGLSYYAVSEWRGIADFSGKKPQLRREPVTRPRKVV